VGVLGEVDLDLCPFPSTGASLLPAWCRGATQSKAEQCNWQTVLWHQPEEIEMKKLLIALLFALSVATVVGCGGSSPTQPAGGGAKPTTKTTP
jgi:hypothetical protein